jgi:RHS repeat-associated protein
MGRRQGRDFSSALAGLLLMFVPLAATHAQSKGTVTYVYTDPQGTPLAEADANGIITATFDYTPYNSQALESPPNGPGYTGHANDPDTGLVYMQARDYDPATGRFLSVDPVASEPGNGFNFNRYAYVNNNPIRNSDPTGKIIQIAGDQTFTQKMNDDIANISQGPGGHALIEKLQNTPNIVYLEPQVKGGPNNTQGDASGISANGRDTGSTIKIDTDLKTGGKDATGNTARPEFVAVSHELGNARAIDQGKQSYDKGTGQAGTTPPSEVHSMANENMVRQEHNISVRLSYYDTPPPKQPTTSGP